MRPVIERIAKSVHGCRVGIVEIPEILRVRHPETVDRAGEPRCLFNDLGPERPEKVPGVDVAVERVCAQVQTGRNLIQGD